MERVPKVEDLPPLAAANLVKAIEPPAEEFSPVGVALFQNIVPDSGTKALSRYTEMVDDLIRNETDTLALASDEARLALREMELPETLIASLDGGAAGKRFKRAGDGFPILWRWKHADEESGARR